MAFRISLLLLTAGLAFGFFPDGVSRENSHQVVPEQVSLRKVEYKGTRFNVDSTLATDVAPETVARSPALDEASAKLEWLPTQHLNFEFKGPYAEQFKNSYWIVPSLSVYQVSDYEKDLGRSVHLTIAVLKDILKRKPIGRSLELTLSRRPSIERNDVPFLPITEGRQHFHARIKYVSFKNGSGVMFLTFSSSETSPPNNEGLALLFQGLSDDGRYGVSGVFPVSVPFLRKGFKAENPKEVALDKKFYLLSVDSKQFQQYIGPLVNRLELFPEGEFTPSLSAIEKVVGSLQIGFQ